MSYNLTDRQKAEKSFHDDLYKNTSTSEIKREATGGYRIYWDKIPDVAGLKVLDYGCGNGWVSIWMAKSGAKVWGIDISTELIKKAQGWAVEEGLSGIINFQEMPCENLTFENNFFDLILGSAILHHTDLNLALRNIKRVLKPDGKAIFIEPMNQNILLKVWRLFTPWRRSPTEKALTNDDLDLIQSVFPGARYHFWNFTSILTEGLLVLFPGNRFFMSVNSLLERIDRVILRLFPGLGKYCAVIVMELCKIEGERC